MRALLPDREAAAPSLVAVSSEGGLFEYGEDRDIVANLLVLRENTPPDCFFVASAIRDVPIARINRDRSHMPIRILHADDIRSLAQQGRWEVDVHDERNPMYHVFRLTKR
jgi:hypothetical protein